MSSRRRSGARAGRMVGRVLGGLVLLLGGVAFAHGGYYQGPKTPDGIPLPTGTPSGVPTPRGGPLTPPTFGPAVTGRKNKAPPDVTPSGTTALPGSFADPPVSPHSWERWWAVHRERFLRAERRVATPLDLTPGPRVGDAEPTDEQREAAVKALLAAARSSSTDVRASAALALARSGDPRGGLVLQSLASGDAASDVCDIAVLSLGVTADEAQVPFLHGLLSDTELSRERRSLAAVALGMCGGADAVDLLVMSFEPDSPRAAKLHPEFLAAGLVGLAATRRPEAIEPLRAALANTRLHPGVRAFAATGLGAVGDRGSIDAFVKLMLQAPEPVLRQAAATALGNLLSVEDVTPINVLLHAAKSDNDTGTKCLSVIALGQIRGTAVREQLELLFAKTNDADKPWRALALGLQGDAAAASPLRQAFAADDYEESLQGAYAIAFALMGADDAGDVLIPELGRRQRFWSPLYCAQALAMLAATDATDALHARMLEAHDARQRAAFATALGLLGDARGADAMRAVLRRQESVYDTCMAAASLGAQRALDALPELVAAATAADRPELVRACAVSALGRILGEGDTPALTRLLAPHVHLLPLDALVLAGEMQNHR